MKPFRTGIAGSSGGAPRRLALVALLLLAPAAPALAAATLTVQMETYGGHMAQGPELGNGVETVVEDTYTLQLIVQGGKVSQGISLPRVDGLTLSGTGSQPWNAKSISYNFFITPARTGDFTIPAFDIRTDAGETLHVGAIKFHVIGR
ncbi:MAG TPA: BatD family protein [Stellaceae bacterium]|nr:BatD family protein [Stellaceae bacterium]